MTGAFLSNLQLLKCARVTVTTLVAGSEYKHRDQTFFYYFYIHFHVTPGMGKTRSYFVLFIIYLSG